MFVCALLLMRTINARAIFYIGKEVSLSGRFASYAVYVIPGPREPHVRASLVLVCLKEPVKTSTVKLFAFFNLFFFPTRKGMKLVWGCGEWGGWRSKRRKIWKMIYRNITKCLDNICYCRPSSFYHLLTSLSVWAELPRAVACWNLRSTIRAESL